MIAGISDAIVTGGTGFIGAALALRLAREGVRVTCPVRAGSPRAARLAGVPGLTVAPLRSFDPESLRSLANHARADFLFHLASYGVDPKNRVASELTAGNVALTTAMVGLAKHVGARRLVFTGTFSEYVPVDEPELLDEEHPIQYGPALEELRAKAAAGKAVREGAYGAAKAAAEVHGAAAAAELGVPFVPLRLFQVYGPGEASHRLIPYVVHHLLRGEVASLTGGAQARDVMFIDDMLDALILAATSPGVVPGTPYNVCTGEAVVIRKMAELAALHLGKPGADLGFGRVPYRDFETMWIVGSPARFDAATGFRPKVGLAEGVARTVDWVLAQGEP